MQDILDSAGDAEFSNILLLVGWLLSTIDSVTSTLTILRHVNVQGARAFLAQYEHVPGVVYNVGQLVTNVLFLLRDFAPRLLMAPGPFDRYDGIVEDSTTQNATGEFSNRSDEPIGVFLTMQSIVMVALYVRALLFFRGFLAFGHLMYITIETVKGILPFMILLIMLVFGFALAQSLLLVHVGDTQDTRELTTSLFLLINSGFDFLKPLPREMRYNWQVLFWYESFSWTVQLVLLNLLIAAMTRQLEALAAQGKHMAKYERAKLCLDFENLLISTSRRRGRMRETYEEDNWRTKLKTKTSGVVDSLSKLPHRDLVSPKWLHVLLPPLDDSDDGGQASRERAAGKGLVDRLVQQRGLGDRLVQQRGLGASQVVPSEVLSNLANISQNVSKNHEVVADEIANVREDVRKSDEKVQARLDRLEAAINHLLDGKRDSNDPNSPQPASGPFNLFMRPQPSSRPRS